jgi:hypothetical protein
MDSLTIVLLLILVYVVVIKLRNPPKKVLKVRFCAEIDDIKGGGGPLLEKKPQKAKSTRKACISLSLKSDQEVSNM